MSAPPPNHGQWDPNGQQAQGQPQVSYNADQFDEMPDSDQPQADGYSAQPTQSYTAGGYGQTGAYEQTYDQTYDQTAAYGEYQGPPVTGGYPAQSGPPTTGGFPSQPWQGAPPPKKSKKALWLSIGAAIVAVAVGLTVFLVTRFGGIQNADGEIANAEKFLSDTESAWRDQLPEDGIEVSSKAACYYVLNKDDHITNEVACGPARRASTAEGEVWDIYPFEVTGSGDKQEAGQLGEVKLAQKTPSNATLVDVNGDAPEDDGLSLKEPPLPRADANGLWTSEQFVLDEKNPGEEISLDGDSRLIGPGVEVTLDSVAKQQSAQIDGKLYQAAENQSFYVVTLTGSQGVITEYAANQLRFELDGEDVPIDINPEYIGKGTYLISVPNDKEALLVLDSDGHTQSLDLLSGARGDDPTTSMYYNGQTNRKSSIGQTLNYPDTALPSGEALYIDATINSATVTPFNPEHEWPEDGNVWVIIDMTHVGGTTATGSVWVEYSLDCSASTLSVGTLKTCVSGGGGTSKFVLSVPAATTSVTIDLAFTMTVFDANNASQSLSFAPLSTTIAI